jgi:hypothetical protein
MDAWNACSKIARHCLLPDLDDKAQLASLNPPDAASPAHEKRGQD